MALLHSFTPDTSASSPWVAQGDGECGLWSVHNGSFLPLIPPHAVPLLLCGIPPSGHSPSWAAPAGAFSMGYSPLVRDCSSMGPPRATGPARKPAAVWTTLHGLQLLPGVFSSVVTSWAAASFRGHPPAVREGSPRTAVWISAPVWSFMGFRGQPASQGSFPQAAVVPRHLEHLPCLLLHWLWCLQGCFSYIFLAPLSDSCCTAFFPFLQSPQQLDCWYYVGAILELTETVCLMQSLVPPHEDNPCSLTKYQNFAK